MSESVLQELMQSDGAICVTGGAGFIGSNFIRLLMRLWPEVRIVNYDALTYAGNLENIADFHKSSRYVFVKGDICDMKTLLEVFASHRVRAVVHFAAESHVDRSILESAPFVRTNVLGTQSLIEASFRSNLDRFIHISTDEVYGSLGEFGRFTEDSPIAPNNPYAATKASSDLIVQSYCRTYGFPAVITRCSNNYGPWQFPEKLIPLMIHRAMCEAPLPVYGDGLNVRDWIHVEDHCHAILMVLDRGCVGEVYNIGAEQEFQNIEIVKRLLQILDRSELLIQYIEDRLGHDRRYAMDASKLRNALGWKPVIPFHEGLEQTVQWYCKHQGWVQRIASGDFLRSLSKRLL